MSDEKPDLTTTEVRQGNSRKTNLRVLTISIIVVAIGLAIAIWYNVAVSPETDGAPEAGETISDTPPAGGAANPGLENLPTPAPVDETQVEPTLPDTAPVLPAPEPGAPPAPTGQ